MTDKTETVIITGFGPFKEWKVNASWEAVKALMAMPEVKKWPVKLVAVEVPVSYEHVLQKVPELHVKENPSLMVHVGVSSLASKITVEQCAWKKGYQNPDVDGKLPDGHCCAVGSEECISTALDVDAMVKEFNSTDIGVTACKSKAAGRYLCEFIYYRSLEQNNRRSLFVHVPPLGAPYSAEQLGRGLFELIRLALKQLSQIQSVDKNFIGDKGEASLDS